MKALFIAGSIIITLGVTFYLQGRSLVGPEYSFMYADSDWTVYGLLVALAGMVMILAGVVRAKT
ncbi:MAG: hypothetical protein D9C04_01240 [Nitrosopumilus sp. B06]|nr:MAG: hypothetical protein EB828_06245 [Nitrosopumilus sp. D6]RNJ80454.1 MAG: hypothetical protein D9C04_01240 [Nitrosopumilus sp. B06]